MENTTILWKPCPGFENHYEVSSEGLVRRTAPEQGATPGRVLKPYSVNGYPGYGLHRNKTKVTVYAHRLVCEAFYGPAPEGKPYALHGDGSHDNNKADNLRWGSQKDNLADSAARGVIKLGQQRGNTRLTADQVLEIRTRASNGEKYRAIAKDYPVCQQTVEQIVHRQRWTHL